MAVVTDLQYYMDDNLLTMLDLSKIRQDKKFDNLWIYDGDEGIGKSTFAIAHCHTLSYKTGAKFTVDNIFFDLDKMMAFAAQNKKQIILWDEAALGALSTQWQNKTQNKLVQILMTARKMNHYWVFCIPKFHELRRYVVRRAMGLVHVYSPDGLERGYFTYYRKNLKNQLFDTIKRTKQEFAYKKSTFRGKFINYSNKPLIDWDAYEEKKDQAIINMFGEDKNLTAMQEKYFQLKYDVATFCEHFNVTQEIAAPFFGIKQQTLSDWGHLPKKYAFLTDHRPPQ